MQVTPKLLGRQWAYSYLAVGMGLSCDDITNTVLTVRPASSTSNSKSKLHVNWQAFRMWHNAMPARATALQEILSHSTINPQMR